MMEGKIVIKGSLLLLAMGCLITLATISHEVQAVDSSVAKSQASSTSSSPSSSSSSSSSGSSTAAAAQTRQMNPFQLLRFDLASSLRTIGSLVPGLITNVAPLALLVGAATLMMPTLGNSLMGLLRESRRSSNEQPLPNLAMPSAFAQYARPQQSSPQDIYYFTKRSLPSLMSNINTDGLMRGMQDVLERIVKAIDNADKRYS